MADEAKSNSELLAELRALQIELEEFRDYLPDAFLEVDIITPRLLYMNRMAYILFGYTTEDFQQGIAIPDLFADQEYERAVRAIAGYVAESMENKTAYQRTGRQELLAYRMKRKDGSIFPAETQSSLVLDKNKLPIALRTFIRDVSQRQEAEEALKRYQQHLEQLISARTAELSLANDRLRQEIAEHRRAETRISESLQEKDVLLKEVHHRVKNNLQVVSSLLSLQADYIQNEEARRLFRESQHRVKSMALIHEQLYQAQDVARVDLSSYIRTLAIQLFHSYEVNMVAVQLDLQLAEASISLNRAIPCGLVINELVSNALKYAFPDGRSGRIAISLSSAAADALLTLVIADDGVGLPQGLDYRQTESLGLQLVMLLVHQLKGIITLDRSHGTAFKITIPGADETDEA